MIRSHILFIASLLCIGLLITACAEKEHIVPEVYKPKHAHEAYTIALKELDLDNTALGIDWLNAAQGALTSPKEIKAPFEEKFYILSNEAKAFSYKLSGHQGHKIEVEIEQIAGDSTQIFLDAYEITSDSLVAPKLIASLNEQNKKLGFEVVKDSDFIIRFQNELLRSGQFRLKITIVPSLDFPVAGGKKHDIGSLFGVPRDAGRRKHEGIDIFARRHTPIVAPSDGNINWAGVREGSLGGKVIWMRDTIRNQTLYFAHLEDVFVSKGDKVSRGDTIGSVGNSGNAITTAPHLHFGIYSDGAVDPYNFVVPTKTRTGRILGSSKYLGQTLRTKRNTTLKSTTKNNPAIQLNKNQILFVRGIRSSYYNVELPDGTEGLIFYDDIANTESARSRKSYTNFSLLNNPSAKGIVTNNYKKQNIKILGHHDTYLFVETEENHKGWVENIATD